MRFLFAGFVLTMLLAGAAFPADRPNIVLIMSDDMGWSDLGCYGSGMETPNLDALAENGLRFTQFYNTGRCCPTRASLLTGLYPHQAGVGHMLRKTDHIGYTDGLNQHCATIAEVLGPAGYRTYMTGKWHVTRNVGPEGPKDNWPLQRGFDRYYGTIQGGGSYYDPTSLTRGNTQISPFNDPEYDPETFYYTNAISDNAVKFIQEHNEATPEDPFFLYVAYTSAHWPMHALPEDTERFKGKYKGGYTAIREARFERMKEMGLIDPDWELSPQAMQWEDVDSQEWEQRCMEVYAAMIYRMDAGIGDIVAFLEESGQLDNTLILFLQDNGGCAEDVGRQGGKRHPNIPRPDAPTLPPLDKDLAIQSGVIPLQTREGYPVRMGNEVMPGPADTYIAYGEGWANVSNTPFRLYKHYVHEGGISTPLIAHWPESIERAGELEHQPGHLIDIMATCVDIANANYPETRNGVKIHALEGKSLVPAFGDETIERDAIYWEHEGNRAIRVGDWKLVARGNTGPWELYNIAEDRTEMHNLIKEQPERAENLAKKWNAWAERCHVLPVGTWEQRPKLSRDDFSKETRFEIEGDGELSREEAPYIPNSGFAVEVTLEELGTEGVLVAQGGAARGWALYQGKNGEYSKITFKIRSGNGEDSAVSLGYIPKDTKTITAVLFPDGRLHFKFDGQFRGGGTSPSPLVDNMPIDGLQVGRDEGGLVGDYGKQNAYDGEIEKVVIELMEDEEED